MVFAVRYQLINNLFKKKATIEPLYQRDIAKCLYQRGVCLGEVKQITMMMTGRGVSIKPGTWNILEHPGTLCNIREHPGTLHIYHHYEKNM